MESRNTDHENFVVTGKDEAKNQLIVAFDRLTEPTLWGARFEIESLSFLSHSPPDKPMNLLGKARYRDPSVALLYRPISETKAEVLFDAPQRALTPGQVLALYDGERLIGGGTYCLSSLGRADQSLKNEVSA